MNEREVQKEVESNKKKPKTQTKTEIEKEINSPEILKENKEPQKIVDVIFYIPTIYHKKIELLSDFKKSQGNYTDDISDDQGKYRNYLEVRVVETPDCRISKILVTTLYEYRNTAISGRRPQDKNIKKYAQVELNLVKASQNGMLHYIYEQQSDSEEGKLFDLIMESAVYHLVKSLFHKHEFHGAEADSVLRAYVKLREGVKEPDIKATDNEALFFYLKQFENRLRGSRREIRKDFDKIHLDRNFEKNPVITAEDYANFKVDHEKIDRRCTEALGEALYYEALLNSWYNNSFKVKGGCSAKLNKCQLPCESENAASDLNWTCECGLSLKKCKELHRHALNIESAIKGIRLIRLRNKTLFNIMSAFLNEKMHKAVCEQITNVELITKNVEEGAKINKKLLKKVRVSLKQSDDIAKQSLDLGKTGKSLGILGGILGGFGVLFGIVSLSFSIRSCSDEKKLNSDIDSIRHEQHIQNKNIDSILKISNTLLENRSDSTVSETNVSQKPKDKGSPDIVTR